MKIDNISLLWVRLYKCKLLYMCLITFLLLLELNFTYNLRIDSNNPKITSLMPSTSPPNSLKNDKSKNKNQVWLTSMYSVHRSWLKESDHPFRALNLANDLQNSETLKTNRK